MRTIVAAVNNAPLVGNTLVFADARVQFALGMSLLSAGTPMIFMGEEVGASKPFTYYGFISNREDLQTERKTTGKPIFDLCKSLIELRRSTPALRSKNIQIVYTHNSNRVMAFKRWDESEQFLVIASLNNQTFANGYYLDSPLIGAGIWEEVFNSRETDEGIDAVPVKSATSTEYGINIGIPACGFIILRRKNVR